MTTRHLPRPARLHAVWKRALRHAAQAWTHTEPLIAVKNATVRWHRWGRINDLVTQEDQKRWDTLLSSLQYPIASRSAATVQQHTKASATEKIPEKPASST